MLKNETVLVLCNNISNLQHTYWFISLEPMSLKNKHNMQKNYLGVHEEECRRVEIKESKNSCVEMYLSC